MRARRPPGLAGLPADRPPLRHGRAAEGLSPPLSPHLRNAREHGRPLPATGLALHDEGGRGANGTRGGPRKARVAAPPKRRARLSRRQKRREAGAGTSRGRAAKGTRARHGLRGGEREAARRAGAGERRGEEAAVRRFRWRRWFRPRGRRRGAEEGGLKPCLVCVARVARTIPE